MQYLSKLHGCLVIARREGACLGEIANVYLDTVDRQVVGFGYRTRLLGGRERYLAIGLAEIGRDVVLVDTEKSAMKRIDKRAPPGRRIRDLRKLWVATADGKHLGSIRDLAARPGDWRVCELALDGDRSLQVEPERIRFGDELMVPAEYADQVRRRQTEAGLGRRLFGGRVDDLLRAVERTFRRGGPLGGWRGKQGTAPQPTGERDDGRPTSVP